MGNETSKSITFNPEEIDIKEDSKINYVSHILLSGSDKDIRFMLVNERLFSDRGKVGIKQESDQQIVISIETARKLNELLTSQLKIYE